jgi:L-methionine (R)-S-oxide reductase
MIESSFQSGLADQKPELYRQLAEALAGLLGDERDLIVNTANTASLLFMMLPDVNWAGFYFRRGQELVLGPFQGKPACVRIAIGQGVCGAAAARRASVLVRDVHEFPGHIACDAASASELVVPLIVNGEVVGVLDIDSPVTGRFDEDDRAGIEHVAATMVGATEWKASNIFFL